MLGDEKFRWRNDFLTDQDKILIELHLELGRSDREPLDSATQFG
jgi:hypothetical protein